MSQPAQTSLRRLQDVLKRSRRLTTKQDVVSTSGNDVQFRTSWRRLIYVTLKTSNLQRLENVWFRTSWKRPIYVVLKTSYLRRLEDVCKMTSVYQRRSSVYITSKEIIFLILYCLEYSQNFNCSSLGYHLDMEFCTNQWAGLCMIGTAIMKELTTLNNNFYRIRIEERE